MKNNSKYCFDLDCKYDPALLREEYYDWSPYVYSVNSPVIAKDGNGLAYYLQLNGDIISDGSQDGLYYVTALNGLLYSSYLPPEGTEGPVYIDFNELKNNSYLLPNKNIRQQIVDLHFSKPQNGEEGSVATFNKLFYDEIFNLTESDATYEIITAIELADKAGSKNEILTYIHDHPRQSTPHPSSREFPIQINKSFGLSVSYGIIIFGIGKQKVVNIFFDKNNQVIIPSDLFINPK